MSGELERGNNSRDVIRQKVLIVSALFCDNAMAYSWYANSISGPERRLAPLLRAGARRSFAAVDTAMEMAVLVGADFGGIEIALGVDVANEPGAVLGDMIGRERTLIGTLLEIFGRIRGTDSGIGPAKRIAVEEWARHALSDATAAMNDLQLHGDTT